MQDGLREKFQQELEEFRQNCTKGNLEWQFEQRRQLDWKLKSFDRETQMKVCAYHRENIEYQKTIENFPLLTKTQPILRFYRNYCSNHRTIPPLVIFSPPELKFDKRRNLVPSNLNNERFIAISELINRELKGFLAQNYPHNSESPARSVIGDWESKEIGIDSAETFLYDAFGLFPVIFIESDVILNPEDREKDIFYLRVAQWDAGDTVSHPLGDIRLPWKTLKSATNYLSTLHQICAGLLIDEYHLFHYSSSPKLPGVLRKLLQGLPESEVNTLMSLIVARYRAVLDRIKEECPSRIPELALKVAQSLAYLPDQTWAREHITLSNEAIESLTVNFDSYNTPNLEMN